MNWLCLGSVQVLYWQESLSQKFWSSHIVYALYYLGPRPDTGPNQHKERPTIVNRSLVCPKGETDAAHRTTMTVK